VSVIEGEYVLPQEKQRKQKEIEVRTTILTFALHFLCCFCFLCCKIAFVFYGAELQQQIPRR
jgi:hypothetical protein